MSRVALVFVDYKAGPNYEHDVEFLFVSRRRLEVTSVKAAWWPIVRDAQGRTISATGQPPADEIEPWWRSQANRLLGDAGPSGMVMYSAPATLPKGGRIEVEGEDDPVWEAQEPAFVMVVDYHPKTSWADDRHSFLTRAGMFGR